jgi:hypothetical protein
MFIFMIIGAVQWTEGSFWGPAIFWTLAGAAGTLCAAFTNYPKKLDDDAPPENTTLK